MEIIYGQSPEVPYEDAGTQKSKFDTLKAFIGHIDLYLYMDYSINTLIWLLSTVFSSLEYGSQDENVEKEDPFQKPSRSCSPEIESSSM